MRLESKSDRIENQLTLWDDPVNSPDSLRRTEYADRILKGLDYWSRSESLIIGLYGPWGSGKTWLLNQLRRKIEAAENGIIFCDFRPWQIHTNEQILAEFFLKILSILEVKANESKQAKNRAGFWKKLGQLTTVTELGTTVAAATYFKEHPELATSLGALSKLLFLAESSAKSDGEVPTTTELREQLTKSFSEPEAPRILVAIDDFDRLEDEQIRMMIRLIKTTANLPNLNYILLGDRYQIAKALDPISANCGDLYLEKIIQIPLTIPHFSESELRARLWDGLELIAVDCRYDLAAKVGRFESFWREFLRTKLTNFRSIHRLLTLTSFHSRCLTKDALLEVDLLDLIGIDFLRMFAPGLYRKIANDPPVESWIIVNRPFPKNGGERVDSPAASDLIHLGEIDPTASFHLLSHLFPNFSTLLPNLVTPAGYSNDHHKYKLISPERPIWNDHFQSLYFELSANANHFPSSRYKEFTLLRDPNEMIRLMEEWKPRGWRNQLLSRLNDDPVFYNSDDDPTPFLLALSSISDDLSTKGSHLESEIMIADRLWTTLLGKLMPGDRLPFFRELILRSSGVTIPLLVLEQIRTKNNATFSRSISAGSAIPTADRSEIESLADCLLEVVKSRFWKRLFPVSQNESYRFYRMANALGPVRVESILRINLGTLNEEIDLDGVWSLLIAVISGLGPAHRLNLFDRGTLETDASKHIVEELQRFASLPFWHEVSEAKVPRDIKKDVSEVVLAHLKHGVISIFAD
ncbi:MAG: AAA family ATPase [Verrucomicrobiales bacterium]|nr:AAA family ATPase [Verrucomicrobiales bacterium]